ncbi:septation ring formation regulator EzrA [Xylocopilactobacillus apicola]|uniref:Septation ring formation regulator EzrA n=1 Tax=Xylocopilactobacillus apicola TaxID=2932184 RepID=A0AAU9CWE9_9LACO|nr:septation ring formation regulator EzrA [Xylocopilactobacillus apicola]BDR58289.1 septation ring formation regulator EzrA [Xylocopilactobacillus apicola]
MWWIIVFIIFIIILLVWLAIIFYQRRISLKIDLLDQEKNKLIDPNLEEEFTKLAQANPTGESLVTLNRWQLAYDRLKNRDLVDLETFFFEAEDANNKFQFLQGRQKIASLERKLKDSKQEMAQIKEEIGKINEVQDSAKELIDMINGELTEIKRKILAKGYAYGPAQDILENRLARIDESYDAAQQIYLGGDYAKSRALFETTHHELSDLNRDMEEIQADFSQLNKTFPDQLKEIKETYEKMKNLGYQFIDDDFDNQVLTLQNLVDQTIQLLTQAAISDVKTNCEQIIETIDELYKILEREYKARHSVQKNKDEIYQFIIHADRQNRGLSETVFQTGNHFVLHEGEAKQVSDFGLQIEAIRLNYNRDLQKVTDHEAVFSVIMRDLELWRKQLTEIEESQVKIADGLAQKYDKVEQLKQDLLTDDSAFKMIVRYVEKENLPGVPEDYREFYLVVNNELKKAKKALQVNKIDVEEVSKILQLLAEDLITLTSKTNEMIKNARLTDILIQKSAQYQSEKPEVTNSIEQAQKVYAQKFDFEGSVNILAKQLELIKPGSFQEIANNYNDQDQLKVQLNERKDS